MGHKDPVGKIVITHLVEAGPRASRTRTSFRPDPEWQWREMQRLYALSGGRTTYLGDWHSHPDQRAGRLSQIDVRALDEIFTGMQPQPAELLSAIFFGTRTEWQFTVWVASDWRNEGQRFSGKISEALVEKTISL